MEPAEEPETGAAREESPSPTPSVSPTKLFLGGLSWQTTDEKLRSYFSRFGQLEDAVVMMDRNTKLPRGFGFVTFKEPAAAQRAIECGPHAIDDRLIDCKPSIPQGATQPGQANRSRKIFVGGLSPDTTEDEFKTYFSAYGTVVEAQIMIDPTTNRPRGFGFVTFEDEESVHRVFAAGTIHILTGKQVEVKAATPKGSGPQGPSAIAARAQLAGQLAMQQAGWPRMGSGRAGGRFATQPGYAAYPGGPQGPGQPAYGMAPMGPYGMAGSYGYAYAMPGPYPGPYMPGYAGMVPGPYPGPYGGFPPSVYPGPYPPGAAPVAVPMYGQVPAAVPTPRRHTRPATAVPAAGQAAVVSTAPGLTSTLRPVAGATGARPGKSVTPGQQPQQAGGSQQAGTAQAQALGQG